MVYTYICTENYCPKKVRNELVIFYAAQLLQKKSQDEEYSSSSVL